MAFGSYAVAAMPKSREVHNLEAITNLSESSPESVPCESNACEREEDGTFLLVCLCLALGPRLWLR